MESGLKFSCLFSPAAGLQGGFKAGNKVYAEKSVLNSEALSLRAFFFSSSDGITGE